MPAPNWVLWSIGVEIWFSVAFPFLAMWVLRSRFGKALAVCIPLSVLVRGIGYAYLGTRDAGGILNFVSDSVIGRLTDFLFGMLAASALSSGRPLKAVQGYIGLAVSSGLVYASLLLWALWWRRDLPEWSAAFFTLPLNIGLFIFTTRVVTATPAVRWALAALPLQMLGLMCYSIYLWHGITLVELGRPTSFYGYAGYVMAVLSLSFITYRFVEFGAERDLKRLLPRRSPRPGGLDAEGTSVAAP